MVRGKRYEGAAVAAVTVAIVAVMGPATGGLAILPVVSYAPATTGAVRAGEGVVAPALVGVAVQVAHLGEELWSVARFATFNAAWLLVLAVAAATPWRRARLGLTASPSWPLAREW
jgi:hypothetical protein